ncbi:glycosyltransferase family 92 protein [Chromohalobacter sarecensis]|uniref:Glycosyltransferase family 92 protein n=1 Tax=Chromohalobacter sarecensis TaxID=245294 RepID=A0ABV9D3R5_9GAMM|nr:glycosyltransferase family 92 protein [Chromohalobacter sarecensis]MCK0714452.1 glycosyltransferase family 92 protein [Chromohalobacter sarecensis]
MKYSVHSVLMPDDVAKRRQPHPKDGVISDEQLQNFDNRYIFYDVFVNSDKGELVAIGPPALNLKSYVKNLQVFVNGKQRKYSLADYPEQKVSILRLRLPRQEQYDVVLKFPDFEREISLKDEFVASGKKVLTAISKNNDVAWVNDWVEHYRTNYAIDEVYIYDNGSSNLEELESCVGDKANIIKWPFPFGPTAKRFSSFAQPVALNHCLRRFARGGVLFNFDIDELLVSNAESVMENVSRDGVVYFESHNVPYVNPGKSDYSFRDFKYRCPERKKTARKFVCDADANFLISPHNTWVKKNYLFWNRLKRNKLDGLVDEKSYFLHFLGITTNWQPDLQKLKEVTTEDLVEDQSHIRMMSVAG